MMWYYTEKNGLAHYWSLSDPTPQTPYPTTEKRNLLIELDSKIRDIMSENKLLNEKINDILLIVNERDDMTPITAEELLQIIEGGING